jgi:hypothetical protein
LNVIKTVLVCWGCHNNVNSFDGLNTAIYCLTVLEAGDTRPRCWQGWFLLSPLSLGPPIAFPLYLFCILIDSSYKDISHTELGSTLIISFELDYLFKNPIAKYSQILRYCD